jgi:hypothetical protein
MSDIFKITQVTEGDLRGKKIAELSDRPNQPSGFSQGLTAQELKDRFDAFPDVVKEKINELIDMLSSEDATEYFSIESPKYKTLREFLSLFGEKSSADGLNIVDFIYARYALENETSKRWHSLRQIFDQIKADIAELKAGVQPPDDGEGDGGETPPTPPDDGGDDGGGTNPPDDGGDDGEDPPTDEYIDQFFTGYSLDVPLSVASPARILSIGSRAVVSRNVYTSGSKVALSKETVNSQTFWPFGGGTYDICFELDTYDDQLSVTVDIWTRNISGAYRAIETGFAVLDATNPSIKKTFTVSAPFENLYFLYNVSGSFTHSIKAPIVVPTGEPPMKKGVKNATMIEGYRGVSTFNVPNDSISAKCPSFGYGYSDYLNTIDFQKGEYVQSVAAIEEIGEWEMESENVFKRTIEGIEAAEGADAIYCNILGSSENVLNEDIMNAISVNMENGLAVVRVKTVQASVESFVRWATTYKLFYMIRLKEPVHYSISEIASTDTSIEVSQGSTIALLDEAQQDYHKTIVRFTPAEDGEGGGTTTPPEGGDGEEDGGDEPPVYTEEVEYNGVSEAVVPSNALTTASLLNVGGLSKISKNYANYSEVITLESGGYKYKYFSVETNKKYTFCFEIAGTSFNTSFLSVVIGSANGGEKYEHESSFSDLESSIFCKYTFDFPSQAGLKVTIINNYQGSMAIKNISLTKYVDGDSDMDSATIDGNVVKTIRHQKNGVIKDVVLPDAVCSNSIFGYGFGSYTNRYNVEDGVLEENVKVVKGSELTWTSAFLSEYGTRYAYAELPSPCIDHAVECSPLAPMVFQGATTDNGIDVVTQNGKSYAVVAMGENFTSVGDLAKNITFIYALKEPNKIPIADGIDGLIDVEPEGVIQTLNENGERVKSNFVVRYVLQE